MDEIQKKWGVAQRPEIERKFTTDEVAQALGVTTATVSAICYKYGIMFEIVQQKNERRAYWRNRYRAKCGLAPLEEK